MRSLWMGLVVGLAACGGPIQAGDAGGGHDAGGDARVAPCASAMECRGTDECTTYDCRPGDPAADARGCVVEPMCTAEQVCRSGVCVRSCTPEEADGDGDDFDNPGCGGADCNDAVNTINPGATEVCDPAGVDEDCNPNTIRGSDPREGDADNDGLISSACWNPRPDGTENRGPDCDDALPGSQLGTVDHCSMCGDACQFRCDSGSCTGLGQVSVGNGHTCALDGAGALYCWGDNQYGQLGDDSLVSALRPRRVALIASADEVAVGLTHSCARLGSLVQCWGRNESGQLGDGSQTGSRVPVVAQLPQNIPPLFSNPVHAIAAGHFATAAIVGDDRRVYCWGSRAQCGLGLSGVQTTPTLIDWPDVADIQKIELGANHGCALTMGGAVFCFGANDYGQLAAPTSFPGPLAPQRVAGIGSAVDIAVGPQYSCALIDDGTVWCWGANPHGALGDGVAAHQACGPLGRRADCSPTPVQVSGVREAVRITPACVLLADNEVRCWPPAGVPSRVAIPRQLLTLWGSGPSVPFLSGVVSHGTTCGPDATGILWCWGDNATGQAGIGSTIHPAPVTHVLTPE